MGSIPQNNSHVNGKIDALLDGNLKLPPSSPALLARNERSPIPVLPASAALDPALAAGVAPWLDSYIAYSRVWAPDAYENYHEAAALWLLSTIAARRVGAEMGGRRYTSLYIALVGRTSVFTKTTCAKTAIKTLARCGLSFLLTPDEMTPQAFVAELSNTTLPTGFESLDPKAQQWHRDSLSFIGQRGWYYDELGQKIDGMMRDGGHMSDYRGILRSLDSSDDQYIYVTRGHGREVIQRPYLALLGSVTPADLRRYAGRGAKLWNDGFWARFAFVVPPADARRVGGRWPNAVQEIPQTLITPLHQWHKRLGVPAAPEMNWDNDALRAGPVTPVEPTILLLTEVAYEAYYAYREGLLQMIAASENQDLDGNYARLPEKALRVATLLASLDGYKEVGIAHWTKAQQVTERWRVDLHNLYSQLSGEVEQNRERTIEDAILERLTTGPQSSRDLQRATHVSATEMAPILRALVADGAVLVDESTANGGQRKTLYYLPIGVDAQG